MKVRPRVYVVDDDPAFIGALASLIRMIGFDVETFSSAEDFLEAYVASGPACLILDVRLPGMSGLELQRELVAHRSRQLPIVFVTGHADEDIKTSTKRLGAVGFLEKPFPTQELLDTIQKAIALAEEDEPYPLP